MVGGGVCKLGQFLWCMCACNVDSIVVLNCSSVSEKLLQTAVALSYVYSVSHVRFYECVGFPYCPCPF